MLEKVFDVQVMESVLMDAYTEFGKLEEGYRDHLL